MSVDVFFMAFVNGADQDVPTAEILVAFEPYIATLGESFVDVTFGPGDSATLHLDVAAPTVTSFMLSRPCTNPRLGACLYKVMRLGNCVLVHPSSRRAIVLDEAVVAEFPRALADMVGSDLTLVVAPHEASFVAAFLRNDPGGVDDARRAPERATAAAGS